jgi:hypothetical protein
MKIRRVDIHIAGLIENLDVRGTLSNIVFIRPYFSAYDTFKNLRSFLLKPGGEIYVTNMINIHAKYGSMETSSYKYKERLET